MRPGKPLAFGTFTVGEGASARVVPHLGLPGNPVSAMMTFELFGRAAVFTMLGKPQAWERERVRAVAAERIARPDPRRFYARAVVERREGRYHARLTGPQGSGVLTSMALANGIVVVPEEVARDRAGRRVRRAADRARPRGRRRSVTAPEAGTPPPAVRIVAAPASSAALPQYRPAQGHARRGAARARLPPPPRRSAGPGAASPSRSRAAGGSASSARSRQPSWARSSPASTRAPTSWWRSASTPPRTARCRRSSSRPASPAPAPSTESGERLATIAEAELTASLQTGGRSSAVDGLAALLDAPPARRRRRGGHRGGALGPRAGRAAPAATRDREVARAPTVALDVTSMDVGDIRGSRMK